MDKRSKYGVKTVTILILAVLVLIIASINKNTAYILLSLIAAANLVYVVYYEINKFRFEKQSALIYQNRIKKLMNIVSANVVIWTEDKKNLILNDKLRELIGRSIEGMSNEDIINYIFPHGYMMHDGLDAMLSGEVKEFPLRVNSSEIRYYAWNTTMLIDGRNGKYIISIGFDVTENKVIRQQLNIMNNSLSASERRYALAMDLSEIGIIINEHCEDVFHISEELQKMLGICDESIKVSDFVQRIHKEDRLLFETYLKSAHRIEANDNFTHSMEIRVLSSGDVYKWYSYRYKRINTGNFGMPVIGGALIDISIEKEKDLLIEKMAYIDNVTGLNNRNKLMITGQELYDCCSILDFSYWVIVIDIDRFHIINDTCGYNNGNRLLKDFARLLNRKKGKNGFVSRIGADNFVIIVKDCDAEKGPDALIAEIQNEFSFFGNNHSYNQSLSCSAGFSKMPSDGTDFVSVFEHAEFALSICEKRRSVIGYNSSVHDAIIKGTAMEKALADAIEAGELELYYQPKISLRTKCIMGVEALVRWVKPDGEVIPPDQFIYVAENSHLITKIGDYVVREACRQNKRWQDMNLPNIIVSVNLTSEDFYQKNVKEFMSDILSDTGLSPDWVEIELTESLAMKDIDFAVGQMQELRNMGLKIAMDDFGTGYSSLSYIQKMPITLLKLDRSFIISLEFDEVAQEIVSAIIKIAKSKKIETIAEGTETIGQVDILEKLGCDYAQGFLFGKPMKASQITEYLRKSTRLSIPAENIL
ncbi:MAG: bifunctional diguanylate cyclase/phosphodiesterase [Oscillospiraceae bacterium]|nr:bifunctional diguanylate cyclase/phosphodiesterase [Oscillospiraceae bacterium]